MPSEEQEQLRRLGTELASICEGLSQQEWWACSKSVRMKVAELLTQAAMLQSVVALSVVRWEGDDD